MGEFDDVAVGIAQHAEVADDRAGVDGAFQENSLRFASRRNLVDGFARRQVVP